MMLDQLPALVVVIPLLAAAIAPFLGRGALPWAFASLVSWAVLGVCVLLLIQVLEVGPISYAMGSWAPPWGIEYRVDPLNAFVLLIVAGIAAVVTPAARASVEREVPDDRRHFFYSAYLLCVAGLLGIVITGDAFNLYVLLEVSSLATYTLVAMGQQPHALKASFNYLILGTLGATFILIGVGHLYMVTGTLNMVDMAARLEGLHESRTVRSGFVFILVGASLKLALFPLHVWLPNAYTRAPSMVTVLLAATATKVGAYVLLRFLFTIFGASLSFGILHTDVFFVAFGSAAVLIGSVIAIRQDNLKRMLAYSSVAQIGYIVLGIGLANVTGLTAAILHLFNHALMKGALFLSLAGIVYAAGSVNIRDLDGIGRRMPWTLAAFVVGGLSLIGVPLTVGFISKWYLVLGALERGWWPLVVLILIGSLLAAIYVWRVVEAAYFHAPGKDKKKVQEAPAALLIATWLLIVANIYFGLDTDLSVGLSQHAAQQLFYSTGGMP